MKRWSIFLFSILFSVGLFSQAPVEDQVVSALKSGNSKELAKTFIPNLDLTVKGAGDVYSKAQAEQILRKFFDEHPPVDMVIEHSGVSKFGDKYFIGILRSKNGYFRVTFFLKKTEDTFQVKQLRIENSKAEN